MKKESQKKCICECVYACVETYRRTAGQILDNYIFILIYFLSIYRTKRITLSYKSLIYRYKISQWHI